MPSPESREIISALRNQPRLADFSIADQRVIFEQVAGAFPPAEGAVREPVQIGAIAAEWITCLGVVPGDAVILYLHGGGYVIGSITTHRALASRLALASGAAPLLIDYRLAPEHPFPAAIDDTVECYRWLLSGGYAPGRIVIAGDSGGRGLAMASALALRDGGDPLPAAVVCMSPWLDVTCESTSASANVEQDPVVTPAWLRVLSEAYLGGADARTPLASPLFRRSDGTPSVAHPGRLDGDPARREPRVR
jgi:acetyl esterase/lipase